MNERIVELFMQSVDSNYIPVPIEDHIPSWTEKFAELIVKECIDIVDAQWEPVLVEKIREHFGVEQ